MAIQDRAFELDDLGVALCRAQLWIAQGNFDAAQQWARERGLDRAIDLSELDRSEDYLKYHLRKYEYLVLARLLIAQGRADDALAILEPLAARMQQRERMRLVVEALMLQALAFQKNNDSDHALAALEQALTLAEPEGYVRLFVDEGVRMQFMISDLRFRIESRTRNFDDEKQRPLLSYVDRLLAAFKSPASVIEKSKIENHKSEIFPESLSAREREVLQLLADGLSNKAIARKLVVADETVKKHLKNIYGKLDAHSRTEALAQARKLKLL